MDTRIDHAAGLLQTLIEDYFKTGELPTEKAFAIAILALAYLNSYQGHEGNEHDLDLFETGKYHHLVFQEDQAIINIIESLKEQLEMLKNSTAMRNQMMHIKRTPDLRLVT